MKQKLSFFTIISTLVFGLILTIIAATLTLHKDFKTLRHYISQNGQKIKVLQNEVSDFKSSISNLTLSLFGVKFVQPKYVTSDELTFIQKQRGALIEPDEFVKGEQLVGIIRNKFDIHYSKIKICLMELIQVIDKVYC